MTVIFWLVVVLLLGTGLYCLRDEREVTNDARRFTEEVERYLAKRFGAK